MVLNWITNASSACLSRKPESGQKGADLGRFVLLPDSSREDLGFGPEVQTETPLNLPTGVPAVHWYMGRFAR